jgi:hypothetical protein
MNWLCGEPFPISFLLISGSALLSVAVREYPALQLPCPAHCNPPIDYRRELTGGVLNQGRGKLAPGACGVAALPRLNT